jgi:hypothetical protein
MSEEERDILVRKRKYWTKLMKYNLVITISLVILVILIDLIINPVCTGLLAEMGGGCLSYLFIWFITVLFLLISWPLSVIMYVYQSLKIYKIPKFKVLAEKPEVLAKSSGMTATQITNIKEAKELLDQKIITNSEFEKIKNEYTDEDVVTRLKGIAELRDSGVFTEREFIEQKSKILSETPSQTDENLSSKDYDKYMTAGAMVGGVVIGLVVIFIIFLALSGSGGDRAYVEYNPGYCWSGAFHNGGSIITISGCGDKSFNCMDGGDFCTINAQKEEDNSYELCVSIGSRKACTTAAYGVAQV